jgi:hypothetical protein
MSQPAAQPNGQQSFQDLMQAGQDVVQQFERALSGGNGTAPSDLRWPATTPTSVTGLFDLQHRYFDEIGQLWSSFLSPPGVERKPVAAPAKGDNRFRDEAWQKESYYGRGHQSGFPRQARLLGQSKAWGRAGCVARRGAGHSEKLVARLGPLAQGALDRHDSRAGDAREPKVQAGRASAWALRQDQSRLSRNVGHAIDRRKP